MSSTKLRHFCNLNRLSDIDEDPLFCGNCKNWLTNQIFLDSNGKYFCQSCIPKNNGQRVMALENISKNFLYPCLHTGCDFIAKGGEIHAHTEKCQHVPSNCCLCDARKMDPNSYRDHLRSKHADVVINMDIPVLTIPLKQLDKNDKFIAVLKQHMFLVYIKYTDFHIMVNIARLFNEGETDFSDTFNVYLRCGNSKQKFSKKMVTASNITEVIGATDINIDVINMTQIEIFLCKYNKVMKLGECPICENSLGLQVYQCLNGHNVCADCGKKITACAICRNNSLNLVNCQFLFPNAFVTCANVGNGCLYIGEKVALKSHLNVCSYSDRKCIVCDNNVRKNDINSHMITKHQDIVFENNATLSVKKLDEVINFTFYIMYNSRIFAIDAKTIGLTTIKKVGFSCKMVECVNICEAENYKFEIQILDKAVDGKIVYTFQSNCQIANDKKNVVFVYYNSWKKYMSKDNVAFFRCLITQNN